MAVGGGAVTLVVAEARVAVLRLRLAAAVDHHTLTLPLVHLQEPLRTLARAQPQQRGVRGVLWCLH